MVEEPSPGETADIGEVPGTVPAGSDDDRGVSPAGAAPIGAVPGV